MQDKIIINLTIDWEGEDFDGLPDLLELRERIGANIPITHFICPAYFTQSSRNPGKIIQKIISENDETALHIHCYRNLIEAAGVTFRTEPDFFQAHSQTVKKIIAKLPKFFQPRQTGRGVPLSAYNKNEIEKIIRFSKQILETEVTTKKVAGFRAGGWILSDTVSEVLEETDFDWDSSAAPPVLLSQNYAENESGNNKDDYAATNGFWTEMVKQNWGYEQKIVKENYLTNKKATQNGCIQKTTQPYPFGKLTEMPNNAGMSDYASAKKTFIPILKTGLEFVNTQKGNFVINLGFHQEGDGIYKQAILDFFDYIQSRQLHNFIIFETVSETRKRLFSYLP